MAENLAALESEVKRFRQGMDRLSAALSEVIAGQESVIEHVLCALLAGGHVLLEGAPGLGKTLLVRTLASAVDLSFSRIQSRILRFVTQLAMLQNRCTGPSASAHRRRLLRSRAFDSLGNGGNMALVETQTMSAGNLSEVSSAWQ